MSTFIGTSTTETAIWSRTLDPDNPAWSPEVARAILALKLPAHDQERMTALACKAGEGLLSADEEVEIESYRQVTRLLELMKAKAHVAIKRRMEEEP